ncbi:MAG: hypothetical protein WAL67_10970 [Candidatus Cybelea sp.]
MIAGDSRELVQEPTALSADSLPIAVAHLFGILAAGFHFHERRFDGALYLW